MVSDPSTTIESVLQEQRVFEPPATVAAQARIGSLEAYRAMAEAAAADPDGFWGDAARRELHWFEPFRSVLDWSDAPFARWFEGGTTNLSFNCLDRHLDGPRAEKTALGGGARRCAALQLPRAPCRGVSSG
jgi:acetyl-CoA synthetase